MTHTLQNFQSDVPDSGAVERSASPAKWRVGSKVPINVYEGDRPVCQCHTVTDARRIVSAMNFYQRITKSSTPPKLRTNTKEKSSELAG